MNADEDPRSQITAMRDTVRQTLTDTVDAHVGQLAAERIDAHADHTPWTWIGHAVVCARCQTVVLPEPKTVLDHQADAWKVIPDADPS